MPLSVQYLLQDLDDPFVLFPIQSVCKSLNDLVRETDESFIERLGPYGVARKFWDVPAEILHEEIGLLLGAAFVLGQATITQTISLLRRIRQEAGVNTGLTERKSDMLTLESLTDPRVGKSPIEVIDLAANYFKHHQEWPDNWATTSNPDLQARTIRGCVDLGMRPGEMTNNMYSALQAIGPYPIDVSSIQQAIQSWRGRLARRLYAALNLPDPELQTSP